MRRWITWIGSALMVLSGLAYGAKHVVPMKTDGNWWAAVLGTLATGATMTGAAQFRTVKKTVGLSVMPEIETLQLADLNAWNHLVERFAPAARNGDAKAKAAVEMCRSLFTQYLFDLHYLTAPAGDQLPAGPFVPPPPPAPPPHQALAEALNFLSSLSGAKPVPSVPVPPPAANKT